MRQFFWVLFLLLNSVLIAQQPYQFSTVIDLEATPVISQGNTGTCWSFSSTSFLESEIIRKTGRQIDLSEIYTVRMMYPEKARNYVMRQGKAQFSQGGLAHDVMHAVKAYGLVPQSAYTGLRNGAKTHNHAELEAILSALLKTYVENPGRKLSAQWPGVVGTILDVYLGKVPETFTYEGKRYTPQSFLEMTGIEPDDYVSITSFDHVPFYHSFILNIPDNWSNGSFYNIPLDTLMSTITHALEQGYTIELDCDVSEPTFSSKEGIAVIPSDTENPVKSLMGIYPERDIDQAYRQQEFENYHTTDDHLMHITGLARDQNGNMYYKVKNSWGTDKKRNANGGYLFFSDSYMRLKTISITLHKDALPPELAKKLNL